MSITILSSVLAEIFSRAGRGIRFRYRNKEAQDEDGSKASSRTTAKRTRGNARTRKRRVAPVDGVRSSRSSCRKRNHRIFHRRTRPSTRTPSFTQTTPKGRRLASPRTTQTGAQGTIGPQTPKRAHQGQRNLLRRRKRDQDRGQLCPQTRQLNAEPISAPRRTVQGDLSSRLRNRNLPNGQPNSTRAPRTLHRTERICDCTLHRA